MGAATLELPSRIYQQLHAHLLRLDSRVEQAAFVFARAVRDGENKTAFQFVDWLPIPPEGFAVQLEYHIELADDQRQAIIKQAHDLNASVIEFHSHTGSYPAEFSPSDMAGFTEFVPHVWWRLKNRPYAAIVVTRSGFDALTWIDTATTPEGFEAIILDGTQRIEPTQRSLKRLQRMGGTNGTF